MVGLTSAIANAQSGLVASATRANVASQNIANASMPGYARQSVSLNSTLQGSVEVSGISRAETPVLTADRRRADSDLGYASTLANSLDSLATAMGDPDQEISLFNDYARLEEKLREYADTPESTTLQYEVITAGKNLIGSFGRVQDQITIVRNEAEANIGVQVQQVNTSLERIHELNSQIVALEAIGENASSLRQDRDLQLDTIAKIIPIKIFGRNNGHIAISLDSGVSLLEGTVHKLDFTPTTVVGAETDYRGGVGPLSGVSVNGVDITPQGASNQTLRTGSLAALFEIRDGEGFAAQQQLDSMALDLIERFADPAVEPGLAAGDAGLFGDNGDTYDATNITGLAGRLTINTAIDPEAGGELWRLRDGVTAAAEGPVGEDDHIRDLLGALTNVRAAPANSGITGDKSASQLAADISSFRATKAESTLTQATFQSNRQITLSDAELANTGVDVDQELQALIAIENAYGANARVLQTVNSMLQTILEL
jgi:flagellar hook-associated protein 1